LIGSAPYEALLVPDAAIGTEQARKFVLIVGPDNSVNQKYVTLGEIVDDLRVIKTGLAAEDRVIVNGLMRARPGATGTPHQRGARADAAPPAAPSPGPAPAGAPPAPAGPPRRGRHARRRRPDRRRRHAGEDQLSPA